jgi:hypothetical protein
MESDTRPIRNQLAGWLSWAPTWRNSDEDHPQAWREANEAARIVGGGQK